MATALKLRPATATNPLASAAKTKAPASQTKVSDAVATRACEVLAHTARQAAWRTGSAQKYTKIVNAQENTVKAIPATSPWAKLAKELLSEATQIIDNEDRLKSLPPLPSAIPTKFKSDAATIEAGLKIAHRQALYNNSTDTIRKCVAAARKAIASLPEDQAKAKKDLGARLYIVDYLVGQGTSKKVNDRAKIKPIEGHVAASQSSMLKMAAKILVPATLFIVGNSLLQAFFPNIMPSWTRFGSIQQLASLISTAPIKP